MRPHARSPFASLVLLVAGLAVAPSALADEVHLKDGGTLVGEARWTDRGLEVQGKHGTVVVPREDVLRVAQQESPSEAFARRLAALDRGDLAAVAALGRFGAVHGLDAEARPLLLDVWERAKREELAAAGREPSDPAAAARRAAALAAREEAREGLTALDYRFIGDRPVPPEEYYPQQGYTQMGGRWISPEEALRRHAFTQHSYTKRQEELAMRAWKRAIHRRDAKQRDLDRARADAEEARATAERCRAEQERLRGEDAALAARLRQLAAQVAAAEEDEYASRMALEAYLANARPCACPGACCCGAAARRAAFERAWLEARGRAEALRRERGRVSRARQGVLEALREAGRLERLSERRAARADEQAAKLEGEVGRLNVAIGVAADALDQARARTADAARELEAAAAAASARSARDAADRDGRAAR